MRPVRSFECCALIVLAGLLFLGPPGCGKGTSGPLPGPLKDREALAAALPPGVTFETAVIPDARYGFARTVEDALTSLQANVEGGAIHDGIAGQEIRFERGQPASKSSRKPATKSPYTVIKLTK